MHENYKIPTYLIKGLHTYSFIITLMKKNLLSSCRYLPIHSSSLPTSHYKKIPRATFLKLIPTTFIPLAYLNQIDTHFIFRIAASGTKSHTYEINQRLARRSGASIDFT